MSAASPWAERATRLYVGSYARRYRAHDDQTHVGGVLSNIGLVYGSQGRTDEALACLEQALAIQEQSHDSWRGRANTHDRLGTVLDRLGHTENANEHWRTALSLYEQLGDPQADNVRRRLEN